MMLFDLIENIDYIQIVGKNVNIAKLSQNSKKMGKNVLFFCIFGTKVDGTNYVSEAITNGAVAIITQKKLNIPITQIVVKNARKAMAKVSAKFFGEPDKKLKIIGITGTNGKTSTSYLIADILKKFGKKVGVIGTSGIFYGGKRYPATMTTPDSIDLFEIFFQMVCVGTEFCIMEVSAHAIYLHKVFGINFCIKALTNVATDHLDFFGTQKKYENVKKSFFKDSNFVINGDDKVGKLIYSMCRSMCLTYGKQNYCNIKFFGQKLKLESASFYILENGQKYKIVNKLAGEFNIYNSLCAYAVLRQLNFDGNLIVKYLCKEKCLKGRFDIVYSTKKINIIIDYAHTVDSLKNFLLSVKKLSTRKNIIIFGCPGERESQKRQIMGILAGKNCETVIVTTDNPASENPRRIMYEIACGVRQTKAKCMLVENRKEAIKTAFKISKSRCNILIVGKGTESYQIVGDSHLPYSDYKTVKCILKKLH